MCKPCLAPAAPRGHADCSFAGVKPKLPPAPVDLSCESVAGEEDPGASIDEVLDQEAPPGAVDEAVRVVHDDTPPPTDDTRAG